MVLLGDGNLRILELFRVREAGKNKSSDECLQQVSHSRLSHSSDDCQN